MATYEVATPSTLLLRLVPSRNATAALRLLDDCLPCDEPAGEPYSEPRIATLADVSSDGSTQPIAACEFWHEPGMPVALLGRFAVGVPFRRRGLGRRLLGELCTALRGEDVQRLWAPTASGDGIMGRLLTTTDFVISDAQPPAPFPAGPPQGRHGLSWWARDL